MQLAVRSHLKTEEIDEGRMSDIDAMRKRGASAAEIAKELKLDVKAVKAILGEELTEEEGEEEKLKKEVEKKNDEIALLKQKQQQDKAKSTQAATQKMVNPETGEPLLQVGIAYKHLKAKLDKEKEEKKQKENSQKIKDLASDKKGLEESNASDKAKGMGLDYMKFGRYGKDGKVTHKTSGDNLVKVGKDDEPTGDKTTKKPDEPKGDDGKVKEVEDPKVKSKKFLQSLEAGKIEDENGVVELDFDDEQSFEAAAEKARTMGLDDLADDIDSVGGYVQEMEPEKAQAEYQDMMSKYSGKPNKALEYSKKADEAITMMSDQTYAMDAAPFADDLSGTLSIMKQMVDSDETEGNVGSGMSNPMKGFRPEVIDTLQSVTDIIDHAAQLEDETDNKKVQDILAQMQGELNFISDENDSPTIFKSPTNPDMKNPLRINVDKAGDNSYFNELTYPTVEYKPVEGRLLIFRSYLEHSTKPKVLTDKRRIIFSFNFDPK